MNTETSKRRTVFIQPKYQSRSILTVVGIIALSGILSGVVLFILLSSELTSGLYTVHQQLENTRQGLAPAIILGNILTVIITSIVAGVAVLYQSHKIAGPMYRLQTICDEVARGNLSPVTSLRKDDQLTALAASFENMVKSLQSARDEQNEHITRIKTLLEKVVNEEDSMKRTQLTEELQRYLDKI